MAQSGRQLTEDRHARARRDAAGSGLAARRAIAGLALGLATLVSVGCGTGDSVNAGEVVPASARAERQAPQHEAYATLGYRLAWRGFPDVSRGHRITGIDPLGDVVLVRESATRVSALDMGSGSLRWSDQLAGPLTTLVGSVAADGFVVVVSDTEAYVLESVTGNLSTRFNLNKVTTTPPMLAGRALVVTTTDGQVIAYDWRTGYRLWANAVGAPVEVGGTTVQAQTSFGDTLVGVIASRAGEVLVVDLATGNGVGRDSMRDAPGARPAVSDTTAFIASRDQSVYGFDLQTARQLWRYRTESVLTSRPAYHDGGVFVSVPGRGMVALDAASGRERWTADTISGEVVGVRRGRLVVWNRAGGEVSLVDPRDGQLVERVELAGVRTISTDAFVDGNLFFGTSAGVVERLEPR